MSSRPARSVNGRTAAVPAPGRGTEGGGRGGGVETSGEASGETDGVAGGEGSVAAERLARRREAIGLLAKLAGKIAGFASPLIHINPVETDTGA
jgi:hypothetical protein